MEENIKKIKNNINIPNALSAIRILLLIPFTLSILKDNYIQAGIILVLSGLSDLLDGFIARRFNQVTKLGGMLDPVADKLTLVTVMVCIGSKFKEIIPLVTILVIKECSMLLAALFLLKKHKTPPIAKWYGKLGTIVFYISVVIIVSLKAIWHIENRVLNITLMFLTALCMVYAVIRYLKIFMAMIENEK